MKWIARKKPLSRLSNKLGLLINFRVRARKPTGNKTMKAIPTRHADIAYTDALLAIRMKMAPNEIAIIPRPSIGISLLFFIKWQEP
jgi:hypothetical protein